jgi:hypothetical protein
LRPEEADRLPVRRKQESICCPRKLFKRENLLVPCKKIY